MIHLIGRILLPYYRWRVFWHLCRLAPQDAVIDAQIAASYDLPKWLQVPVVGQHARRRRDLPIGQPPAPPIVITKPPAMSDN